MTKTTRIGSWGFRIVFSTAIVASTLLWGIDTPGAPPPDRTVSPGNGCRRCHAPGKTPATDLRRPECAQCHSPLHTLPPTPDTVQPVAETTQRRTEETITEQKMIRIPAGSFIMGNNGRPAAEGPGNLDETPAHEARTGEYLIDQFEVTNAHYRRFVEDTGHPPPVHWRHGVYPEGKADHPVVYVSWYDARDFCRWAGKRLPTEAEWEKAARGTKGRHFPWGDQFDPKRANTPQGWLVRGLTPEEGDTMPVGSFENGRSPYGLYDMAGNVYEWVADWYQPYPGNRYPNMFYGERNKVLRGGSWYDCLSYGCGLSAPAYNRSRFTPEIKNSGFGFRCAKDTGSVLSDIERKSK